MYPKIEKVLVEVSNFTILEERKVILNSLIEYIQQKVNAEEEIRLNFICTHNSRRSHLSQIWAQTMAFHFNIKSIFCYSLTPVLQYTVLHHKEIHYMVFV